MIVQGIGRTIGILLTQDPNDLVLGQPASLHPSVPPQRCGLYSKLKGRAKRLSVT
jgi:hypothetical protein